MLTLPDIISQAMLGGPMYLLYEAAIFIGGRIETYQRANNPYWADDSADDENENQFDAASDEDDDDAVGCIRISEQAQDPEDNPEAVGGRRAAQTRPG